MSKYYLFHFFLYFWQWVWFLLFHCCFVDTFILHAISKEWIVNCQWLCRKYEERNTVVLRIIRFNLKVLLLGKDVKGDSFMFHNVLNWSNKAMNSLITDGENVEFKSIIHVSLLCLNNNSSLFIAFLHTKIFHRGCFVCFFCLRTKLVMTGEACVFLSIHSHEKCGSVGFIIILHKGVLLLFYTKGYRMARGLLKGTKTVELFPQDAYASFC